MPLVDLSPGARVDGTHAVVVCVPLYGAHDVFKRCLLTILRHTPPDVPVLIADDADPDPAAYEWVRSLDEAGSLRATVHWLRQPQNRGFPGNVNAAFAATAPADVAVVNSDCEVAARWLEGLGAAAYDDTNVASATALTNHGTIVSVPWRNRPQPNLGQTVSFDLAAARVRERSPVLRPRIPTLVGHCFYVRRDALDLVGDFDERFSPGYGEEVDFSQRCIALGLQHVVADEVLVLHRGGESLSVDGKPNPVQEEHEDILHARYPWYAAAVEDAATDMGSSLARSLAAARRALAGLRITIDGRILSTMMTGTQVNTLEFVHALWRTGARVRVIVPPDLDPRAKAMFAEMEHLEQFPLEHALHLEPDDIVHRPYQISSEDDLQSLMRLGERVVLTQLDLIAYRNPTYFASSKEWLRYRRLTRAALTLVDLVCFCTTQGARDALADSLLDESRTRVVALGADHRVTESRPQPRPPESAIALDDRPFMLCLGTDFRHKNRVFALRVLESLRERHNWPGRLILAGPRVAQGSSDGNEAGWLAAHEESAEHVVALPAIDEAQKAWLMDRAAAVLYPTTYEGFGFIPFEASAAGVPCFFAHATSMADTLDGVTGVVKPWDADATADAAIEYLHDGPARTRLLAELRTATEAHTWDRTARESLAAYEHAFSLPLVPTRGLAQDRLRAERDVERVDAVRAEFEGKYWELRNDVGPIGFTLVGPDARLPPDAQRALSALTARQATRVPLVAGLRMIRRLSRGDTSNPS